MEVKTETETIDRTIWKFPLALETVQTISIPKGAEFRHVADQLGTLAAWFEVNPSAEKEERVFYIAGTGNEVPALKKFLGSVLQGPFVWHVYTDLSTTDFIKGRF